MLPAILFLTALTSANAQQSGGFWDGHVHLNDVHGWLQLMAENGIGKSLVLRGRSATNESLLAAAEMAPERLVPFASISPEHAEYRSFWEADDPAILGVLDSLLASDRFAGIGEISVSHFPSAGFPEADYPMDGRIMSGIMEAARHRAIPVLIHAEMTRIQDFRDLLDRYPDVAIIWAHGGYTPMYVAYRMLSRYPNLTYELSARTWRSHPRSPDFTIMPDGFHAWTGWLDLVEAMPRRFIVGTDASLRSLASDQQKIYGVNRFLEQLSPSTRYRVERANLEALLDM